ncbi:hypothetical protein [Sphingomonas sp.]|uniref:hypothetical protein n=1 Tax=Sphingomonas sp. TaxID=28214 RepID=UPI0025F78307|nr:hypothetical protein [Sphingomonas sp.]
MSYIGYNRGGYAEFDDPPPPRPRKSGWMLLIALGLSALSAFIRVIHPEPGYDGTKIAAGTFPWPDGCPSYNYRPGNRLPRACFDRFQKVSSQWARAHHLKIRRSSRASWYSYYRIGDDAVEDFCIIWEDDCAVGNIYRSVFVTDRRIADGRSYGWRTLAPGQQL